MWDKITRFAGDRIKDIQQSYNKADEALDGWLPGGVKQSPLTQTYQQNAQDPGYSIEEPKVNRVPGLSADTPILTEDGTLTPQAKEFVRRNTPGSTVSLNADPDGVQHIRRGAAGWANPLTNNISLTPSGENFSTLAHEAGHLNTNRKGSSWGGALGRLLTEPTEDIRSVPGLGTLLAPIRAVGGAIRAYKDAPEEEFAERFTRAAGGNAVFNENDRSGYGSGEYALGIKAIQDAAHQLSPGLATALDIPYEGVKPSEYPKYYRK